MATGTNAIATQREAHAIGRGIPQSEIIANQCCTRHKAYELGCAVRGASDIIQLVKTENLFRLTNANSDEEFKDVPDNLVPSDLIDVPPVVQVLSVYHTPLEMKYGAQSATEGDILHDRLANSGTNLISTTQPPITLLYEGSELMNANGSLRIDLRTWEDFIPVGNCSDANSVLPTNSPNIDILFRITPSSRFSTLPIALYKTGFTEKWQIDDLMGYYTGGDADWHYIRSLQNNSSASVKFQDTSSGILVLLSIDQRGGQPSQWYTDIVIGNILISYDHTGAVQTHAEYITSYPTFSTAVTEIISTSDKETLYTIPVTLDGGAMPLINGIITSFELSGNINCLINSQETITITDFEAGASVPFIAAYYSSNDLFNYEPISNNITRIVYEAECINNYCLKNSNYTPALNNIPMKHAAVPLDQLATTSTAFITGSSNNGQYQINIDFTQLPDRESLVIITITINGKLYVFVRSAADGYTGLCGGQLKRAISYADIDRRVSNNQASQVHPDADYPYELDLEAWPIDGYFEDEWGNPIIASKITYHAASKLTINSEVADVPVFQHTFSNEQGTITFQEPISRIQPGAFYYTELEQITLPDTVTSIGASAFEGCSSLVEVLLPTCLTVIEEMAFAFCSSLNGVTIPSSVRSIGSAAFYECIELYNIIFNTDQCNIEDFAFSYCYNLYAVSLPSGTVGMEAFSQCLSLEYVEIASNVTSLGAMAFSGCDQLQEVHFYGYNTTYGSNVFYGIADTAECFVPCGALSIYSGLSSYFPGGMYDECATAQTITYVSTSSGTKITIGTNLADQVAEHTISGSTGTIKFKAPLTTIPASSFANNSYLRSMTLPEGIHTIGSSAFQSCQNLRNINFPTSLTTIGSQAFYGCSYLSYGAALTIPSTVTSVGSRAFQNCTKIIRLTLQAQSVAAYAFQGCSRLTTLMVGTYCTAIGNAAFKNCSALSSITFNSTTLLGSTKGQRYIYDQAFQGTAVSTVTIPRYIAYIGAGAFSDCPNLQSIKLPISASSNTTTTYSSTADGTLTISAPQGGTLTFTGVYSGAECVLPGTQILVDLDGTTKNVEDLVVGDGIVTYDQGNAVMSTIDRIVSVQHGQYIKITLQDGKILCISSDHAIYTMDGWKAFEPELTETPDKVGMLLKSDSLLTTDGYVKISTIKVVNKLDAVMYNLGIAGHDDYYANGILVHECAGSTNN